MFTFVCGKIISLFSSKVMPLFNNIDTTFVLWEEKFKELPTTRLFLAKLCT